MPYIDQASRYQIMENGHTREELGILVANASRNAGDLQYILAVTIQQYLKNMGLNYENLQDIMGALTGAQSEFIARIVTPYESEKIAQNGHVYDINILRAMKR